MRYIAGWTSTTYPMKLQTKYIFYVLLIHLAFAALAVLILEEHKGVFVLAEVLIAISLIISFYFMKAFSSPINLIDTGIQSLKDREFNTKFLRVGQYEMDSLIDVYNQMIDELRSERLNKIEQNYFLDKLVQASPSGIVILDLSEKIKTLNPAALRILGQLRTSLIGKSLRELQTNLGNKLEALNIGESSMINVEGSKKYKCQKDQFLYNGFHQTFIVVEDLTLEVLETEKKAYEKVIRMMSHEVNNSIGAINSILTSVLSYSPQLDYESKVDYEKVLKVAIDRNSGVIDLMKNFSDVVKLPAPNRREYDLNALAKTVYVLTEPLCRKQSIQLELQTTKDEIMVHMDGNQMEQVLINIIKNAMESIQHQGTIKLQISSPAKVVVEDDGKGIPEEASTQLFTPFFSTKKDGQGIGLTMTREILMNHGFDFNLETKPSGLTQFEIKLA